MLLFGVTIPATALQRSEIPEGIMNYPVDQLPRRGTGVEVNIHTF
jgi:hypothetical protein